MRLHACRQQTYGAGQFGIEFAQDVGDADLLERQTVDIHEVASFAVADARIEQRCAGQLRQGLRSFKADDQRFGGGDFQRDAPALRCGAPNRLAERWQRHVQIDARWHHLHTNASIQTAERPAPPQHAGLFDGGVDVTQTAAVDFNAEVIGAASRQRQIVGQKGLQQRQRNRLAVDAQGGTFCPGNFCLAGAGQSQGQIPRTRLQCRVELRTRHGREDLLGRHHLRDRHPWPWIPTGGGHRHGVVLDIDQRLAVERAQAVITNDHPTKTDKSLIDLQIRLTTSDIPTGLGLAREMFPLAISHHHRASKIGIFRHPRPRVGRQFW